MKTYRGVPIRNSNGGYTVTVDHEGKRRRQLNPRFDIHRHSPDGFAWGYLGDGPAQLALALLADAFGNQVRALQMHQRYKEAVIANLPAEKGWVFTEEEVREAVRKLEMENRRR